MPHEQGTMPVTLPTQRMRRAAATGNEKKTIVIYFLYLQIFIRFDFYTKFDFFILLKGYNYCVF
jgi:hypothetical protein